MHLQSARQPRMAAGRILMAPPMKTFGVGLANDGELSLELLRNSVLAANLSFRAERGIRTLVLLPRPGHGFLGCGLGMTG